MPAPRRTFRNTKPPQTALTARWLALQAIQGFAQRGAFAARVLDDFFDSARIDPRERKLATELAHETIRRRLTLNAILHAYVSRARESIDNSVWITLQLGVCQLVCLPRIALHAAIHETVDLCDRLHQPQAKGFVNGVLRTISRELQLESSDAAIQLPDNRRELPLLAWDSGQLTPRKVKFTRQVFADSATAPLTALSQWTSLPEWLLQRLQQQFPQRTMADWLQLGLYFTTQGRYALRVNPLKSSREQLLAALVEAGAAAEPGELTESIRVRGGLAVSEIAGFQQGWCSVQDESAMAVTELLAPQPGETILDMCAAPGGKTCHLAERLAGSGQVVACDIHEQRLSDVRDNAARLGLENVSLQLISPEGADIPSGPFDAVLVDVPCSNTGVLGKRPEARWRLSPESIAELAPLQRRLLSQGLERTRSGGRVVYSTCSIDREENEAVVAQVLSQHPEWTLVCEHWHWPGQPADGGYQALLQRS